MKLSILILCFTNWICTIGGGKTFIIPYSSINHSYYYTEHHLDFGDGSDTTFIGIHNPIALAYQAIEHSYDSGIHIATLTTNFFDSITNILICTSIKQDTVCNLNITYVNEINKLMKNKIYNLQGIELLEAPKNMMYIQDRKLYYKNK